MKVHKIYQQIIPSLVLFFFLLGNTVETVADDVFKTFTENGYSEMVQTQDAYLAKNTISVFDGQTFNKPMDMKFGIHDEIYVADSGNNRIVVLTKEGELIRIIKNELFAHPTGIYINDQGHLYVADDAANKVFVLDEKDEVIHIFEKPNVLSFGEKAPFSPTKVTVDSRGNAYVLSRGNNNGLIILNKDVEGEFLGYFAPNATSNSLLTTFRKMIFSEEQLDKMLGTTPDSATNLNIDSQGLIYTITPNEKSKNVIKKLNMGGINLLKGNYVYFPSSLAIGEIDNIFTIGEDGYIYEYTSEGEFLFMFGGKDDGKQRRGLIGKGSGILVDSDGSVYTLDEKKNEIQTFIPTQFSQTLHEALALYQKGRYEESKEPWSEVLRMNSQFDFASLGLGQAYFKEENYSQAMVTFRDAKDKVGYSDSFWEIRNIWIRNNVIKILAIVLILVMIVYLFKIFGHRFKWTRIVSNQWNKLLSFRLVQQIRFLKYYMLHPLDGAYGIKKEFKTSNLSTAITAIIALFILIMNKYFTGFIFSTVREGTYTLFADIIFAVVIFSAVIISTYLICTITDGSASFKFLFYGFIYSLAPYLLIKPFVIFASNILTLNEVFLLTFTNAIIYVWMAVLFFLTIKELNEFTVFQTMRTIFLSVFALFIASLALFILYSLFQQLFSFSTSLYGEVVHRIENQ